MERFFNEASIVDNNKEDFKNKINSAMNQFEKNVPIKVIMTGAEGPVILLEQNEQRRFFPIYHGGSRDYRPDYKRIAEEAISDNNYQVFK
jgi:hypothetical protein